MKVSTNADRIRRAFTLVELLTVIVIIGILAALITAASQRTDRGAREARVSVEIKTLDLAMKAFRDKYGDFPPDDLSDQASVTPFLRRAFPRYRASGGTLYDQFKTDLQSYGLEVTKMTHASALVFWLGGCPTFPSGSAWHPSGFGLDPEHPFQLGTQVSKPLFDFDPDRLDFDTTNGQIGYFPDIPGAKPTCPYLYFRARNNAYTTPSAGIGPYARTATEWYNPQTFQIISAGFDNKYGTGSQVLTTGSIPAEHYDNLTNFTDGRLEDLFR